MALSLTTLSSDTTKHMKFITIHCSTAVSAPACRQCLNYAEVKALSTYRLVVWKQECKPTRNGLLDACSNTCFSVCTQSISWNRVIGESQWLLYSCGHCQKQKWDTSCGFMLSLKHFIWKKQNKKPDILTSSTNFLHKCAKKLEKHWKCIVVKWERAGKHILRNTKSCTIGFALMTEKHNQMC